MIDVISVLLMLSTIVCYFRNLPEGSTSIISDVKFSDCSKLRRVLECITQLRLVLESDLVTDDARELELLVNRLFTGFGPEWPTIARITGISQTAIKDILIQTNNMSKYCFFVLVYYNRRKQLPTFIFYNKSITTTQRFISLGNNA